jgi:hypothetical protein
VGQGTRCRDRPLHRNSPEIDIAVQWRDDHEKGVRCMKKLILLLVLVVIGLVIAKQFAGDEH